MQEPYLEVHQARQGQLTPYQEKLSGVIQEIFTEGRNKLPELVQGLNDHGLLAPSGQPWTEGTFREEMNKLGE